MSTINKDDRIIEIIAILNSCNECSPSQCCYSCDNMCDEHDKLVLELYELQEEEG